MADNDSPQLTIEIQLDDGSIKKGVAKLPEHFKPAGKKAGEEMGDGIDSGIKNKLTGIKTMMLGFVGTLAAGLTIGKAISEAAEEEDAVNQLGAALRQTNRYTDDLANSLNDFAGEMQKTTRFSDDAVLSGMALLQTLTNLDEKGLKRATKAAADLASGLHIDLQTAMMLVGKAAEGEIGTFGRYGMKIKEGKDNAETFANTLSTIEKKMGGRAEADLGTFSGGLDNLKNSFNNLLGEMGKYIIKAPIVAAASKEVARIIADATSGVSGKTADTSAMFEMSRGALNLAEALVYVGYGFEGVFNLAKITFNFINYAASIAWGAVIQIANGLSKILPKDSELRQTIENMASAAEETAQERLAALGDSAGKAFDFSFSNAALKSINTIRDSLSAEEARIAALSAQPKDQVNNGPQDNTDSSLSTQSVIQAALFEKVAQASAKMRKSVKADVNDISQAIRQSLAGSISGGIQNIVQSVMSGQNAFSNFAKFVLAAMGDMAIKLGEMFILKGLAIDAMKGLVGGAAVAAGVALVALGTVMKTWSGPLSSGSTSASGSANPTYSDGGTSWNSLDTDKKEEKKEPSKIVNVNIHGNVMDSRETGLRIVDLINQAIGEDGAKVYA